MFEKFSVIDLIKTRSASVCTFAGNVVKFNVQTAQELRFPEYIQFLIEPKSKQFAIRACKEDAPNAVRFSKPEGEQKAQIKISNATVVDMVRKLMDWNAEDNWNVPGIYFADEQGVCVLQPGISGQCAHPDRKCGPPLGSPPVSVKSCRPLIRRGHHNNKIDNNQMKIPYSQLCCRVLLFFPFISFFHILPTIKIIPPTIYFYPYTSPNNHTSTTGPISTSSFPMMSSGVAASTTLSGGMSRPPFSIWLRMPNSSHYSKYALLRRQSKYPGQFQLSSGIPVHKFSATISTTVALLILICAFCSPSGLEKRTAFGASSLQARMANCFDFGSIRNWMYSGKRSSCAVCTLNFTTLPAKVQTEAERVLIRSMTENFWNMVVTPSQLHIKFFVLLGNGRGGF